MEPEQQPGIEPITEPTPVDPYDLGDTDLYPKKEVEAYVKPTAQPAGEAGASVEEVPVEATPPVADSRPRRADGTFLPKQPDHPDWLVAQARDMGFDDADLAVMSTEALGRSILKVRRQTEALRTEFASQRAVQDSQVKAPPPVAPAPEEDDLGIDMSEFDERLVGVLKKLAKENRELRQGFRQREEREVIQSSSQRIDAAFEGLGKPWEILIGKGPAKDMTAANKKEYSRRLAILRQAGINDIRQLPEDFKERIKEAAETLFEPAGSAAPPTPGKVEPYSEVSKNGKLRVSPEEWAEAAVQRPTGRRTNSEPPGDTKAVNNLTQKMKEAGMMEPDSEVLDGLLP